MPPDANLLGTRRYKMSITHYAGYQINDNFNELTRHDQIVILMQNPHLNVAAEPATIRSETEDLYVNKIK